MAEPQTVLAYSADSPSAGRWGRYAAGLSAAALVLGGSGAIYYASQPYDSGSRVIAVSAYVATMLASAGLTLGIVGLRDGPPRAAAAVAVVTATVVLLTIAICWWAW